MDFKELVLKNRSYRGFDQNVRISMEELRDFIAIARNTPSTTNAQPLKYYLSCDDETNAVFASTLRYAGRLKEKLPYPGTEPVAYVMICIDSAVSDSQIMLRDVGIAAQTITLAAVEKGYGCCMVGSFDKEFIKKELKLPESIQPCLALAMGKPIETIQLVDMVDGNTSYYRENGVHYVPKRSLDELILN